MAKYKWNEWIVRNQFHRTFHNGTFQLIGWFNFLVLDERPAEQ